MSSETRSTRHDPLTPENAVLLVDQQEGWFTRISEPEQTRRHLLGLARGARLLGVPTVLTTNMASGDRALPTRRLKIQERGFSCQSLVIQQPWSNFIQPISCVGARKQSKLDLAARWPPTTSIPGCHTRGKVPFQRPRLYLDRPG